MTWIGSPTATIRLCWPWRACRISGLSRFPKPFSARRLLHESALFLDLADKLGAYMPAGGQAKPKHVRGGVDITFPGRRTYPRLLIKQVRLSSGVTGAIRQAGFRASGTVQGITSEPSLYGHPMVAAISAAGPGRGHLDLNASIDHVTPHYRDEVSLLLSELPLPEIGLGEGNAYLPRRIVSGHGDAAAMVRLQPGRFMLDLRLTGRDVVGDYTGQPGAATLMARITREVLARIDIVDDRISVGEYEGSPADARSLQRGRDHLGQDQRADRRGGRPCHGADQASRRRGVAERTREP